MKPTIAFRCPACKWAEDGESIIRRTPDLTCPRCRREGLEAVTDPEELERLNLRWCSPCQTYHY